ncbi:MAG: class I SAM-dependent methyltransferase [Acidimicrobiales bacterium]
MGHYERTDEDARLRGDRGGLELVRTQEIIGRWLPDGAPLRILDVGGGTGVHAEWLAAEGHRVHVVDPVPLHVDTVLARPGPVTAALGDARRLDHDDASFDAVLLLGPLYHLTERDDRLAALGEAMRVVVPGGPVFVAAISRFASLFDGLARERLFDPTFRSIVRRDLAEGQHRNPTGNPEWFTTAFFHHPDELGQEIEAAGLTLVSLLGVEGMAIWQPGVEERWSDPSAREIILEAARATEAEPTLRGLSAHLLAVAARPDR